MTLPKPGQPEYSYASRCYKEHPILIELLLQWEQQPCVDDDLLRRTKEALEHWKPKPIISREYCADCGEATTEPISWCGTSIRCPKCHALRMNQPLTGS